MLTALATAATVTLTTLTPRAAGAERYTLILLLATTVLCGLLGAALVFRLRRHLADLTGDIAAIAGDIARKPSDRADSIHARGRPVEISRLAAAIDDAKRRFRAREEHLSALAAGRRDSAVAAMGVAILHEMQKLLLVLPDKIDDLNDLDERDELAGDIADLERMADDIRAQLKWPITADTEPDTSRLEPIVGRVAELWAPLLESHRVALVLDLAGELPPVRGGCRALERVVAHLVTASALQMTDGGTVTVRTEMAPTGRAVRLAIATDGAASRPRAAVASALLTTAGPLDEVDGDLAVCRHLVIRAGGCIETRPGESGAGIQVLLPVAA